MCEGNGIETAYGAMPMDDDATAEETMDTSLLADDPTDAMGSSLKTLTTLKTSLKTRLTKRKTQPDDAEDDADEAEEDTEVEMTN